MELIGWNWSLMGSWSYYQTKVTPNSTDKGGRDYRDAKAIIDTGRFTNLAPWLSCVYEQRIKHCIQSIKLNAVRQNLDNTGKTVAERLPSVGEIPQTLPRSLDHVSKARIVKSTDLMLYARSIRTQSSPRLPPLTSEDQQEHVENFAWWTLPHHSLGVWMEIISVLN